MLLVEKQGRALPKSAIVDLVAHIFGLDRTLPGNHQEKENWRRARRKVPLQRDSVDCSEAHHHSSEVAGWTVPNEITWTCIRFSPNAVSRDARMSSRLGE